MDKKKIKLEENQATLLIPLYCRALESRRKNPILADPRAREIVEQIDYDFKKLEYSKGTLITMNMRAKQYDNYARAFLARYPRGAVLSLGCGLSSRFHRVDNGTVRWYDLDFPEVISLKRKFFTESERYHFISSSVTDRYWFREVPPPQGPALIIAEGLFMYLAETELRDLLAGLQKHFPGSELTFDAFSTYTVKKMQNHPALKKMQAKIRWGIDDPATLSAWQPGIQFIEEWFFTQSEEARKLGRLMGVLFRLAGSFKVARTAHRLLYYKLGD